MNIGSPQSIYDFLVILLILSNPFIFWFINRKLKSICKGKHILDLKGQVNTDGKAENILSELRALIEADRITLLRFHNGQEFLPNNPVWKLTGTSAVKADGVSDEMIDSLLISRVQPIIEPLITGETDNDAVKIPPVCEKCVNSHTCEGTNHRIITFDVEKMNGFSQSFLQKRGTTVACLATLLNSADQVFGVLFVEYGDTGKINLDKNVKIIQTICRTSSKLRFLFN